MRITEDIFFLLFVFVKRFLEVLRMEEHGIIIITVIGSLDPSYM